MQKILFPISDPRIKMFPVSDISLWFELSLCNSAEYQLSTSSGSGLAFVENHANFHIYWVHHLVSCSSGFRMVFSVLESPQRFLFKYNKLYNFMCSPL